MRLRYFPVNAAWAFVFGDDLKTARPTSMGDYGTFFRNRKDAIEAARLQGLQVGKSGAVSVKKNPLTRSHLTKVRKVARIRTSRRRNVGLGTKIRRRIRRMRGRMNYPRGRK
jgi:hypothetical protein